MSSLSVAATLVLGFAVMSEAGAASARDVMSDNFGRSVGTGWAKSSSGVAYKYPWGTPRGVLSTNGRVGVFNMASGTGAIVETKVRRADVDVSARFALNAMPRTGNGVGPTLHARAGRGAYRLVTRLAPGGLVVASLDRVDKKRKMATLKTSAARWRISSGQWVSARLTVTGTNPVRLVGQVTSPQGDVLSLSQEDGRASRITSAGAVRVEGYVSRNTPRTRLFVDDLKVAPAPAGPVVQPPPPAPGPQPTTPDPAETSPVPEVDEPSTDPSPTDSGSTLTDAGSLPLGSASYPVPQGAVFVSLSGSDANKGTISAPLRTITKATSVTPAGGTIVLRAGAYHESVMMPGHKAMTIQNYPGEAAWMDGSSPVDGWVRSGDLWVRSGWTTKFDSSPTYRRGAPDGTEVGWQFIDPKFPMAAHPDQVFIDGKSLQQVASRSDVGPGEFYADYATSELVIGDDPAGHAVRASDLVLGLTATAPGSVVRGIGVVRFATSVPDMGTLRLFAANQTAENVIVTDNATQGISLLGSGITLRHVTSSDNGLNGIHTSDTNDLTLDKVRVERNNRERFNSTPVAAGIKAHTSRHAVIKDSVFSGNFANGIWFDVSNYDVTLQNNDIIGNSTDGVILELSEHLSVINNRIIGNGAQGLFLLDSGDASIWNNDISGGSEPVRIHDTVRDAADLTSAPYGYDKRRPKPDPTVTWKVYGIDFKNNVVTGSKAGWCGLLCVLNDTDSRPASQMASVDGNVYRRSNASSPPALIRWGTGKGTRATYSSLAAFRAAQTNQDIHSVELVGSAPASLPTSGVALPASVAELLGMPAGAVHVGVER